MSDEPANESASSTMVFNIVAATCIALAIGVMGYWYSQGAHFVTQYEVAVTETVEDEFGDTFETTVMKEQFQFGLLPDEGYDAAAPWAGGLTALAVLLFGIGWWKRRKQKSTKQPDSPED